MAKYCPHPECRRSAHAPDATYCGRCGTRLREYISANPAQIATPPEARQAALESELQNRRARYGCVAQTAYLLIVVPLWAIFLAIVGATIFILVLGRPGGAVGGGVGAVVGLYLAFRNRPGQT